MTISDIARDIDRLGGTPDYMVANPVTLIRFDLGPEPPWWRPFKRVRWWKEFATRLRRLLQPPATLATLGPIFKALYRSGRATFTATRERPWPAIFGHDPGDEDRSER